MQMEVLETADGIPHVALDGRFDIEGALAVDLKFSALAGSANKTIIDLSKVSFLASMGVRTLMVSAKTIIRRGAWIAVCGADQNVEKVLRATGFDELVDLYPDFASAAKGVFA